MKQSMQYFGALIFGVLSFAPGLAYGDGFRCPESGRIVHEGDTIGEVLTNCGEPDFRSQSSFILRRINYFESTAVPVEDWTYDFGPNRFIQLLRFEGGILRRIEHGSYGRNS